MMNIPLYFTTIDIEFQLIAGNKCFALPINSIYILLKDKIFFKVLFKVQSIIMLARIVRGETYPGIRPNTVAKRYISHLIQCTTIKSPHVFCLIMRHLIVYHLFRDSARRSARFARPQMCLIVPSRLG